MLWKSIFFLIKSSTREKHSNKKKIPLAAHYKQPERKEKIK